MATGFRFKGTISVIVSEDRLKAELAISTTGDFEYDQGGLVRTLKDAGVTQGFDTEKLSAAIQEFQRSKKAEAVLPAAEGLFPSEPVPEAWQWTELEAISGSEMEFVEKRLNETGPPEVYRTKNEEISVKKTVATAQGEKVQTVIEKRQIRQKVIVDARTAKLQWAEKDAVVARIEPSRPGTPGKDLSGHLIPAPLPQFSGFLLGANLIREKSELRAQVSGVLRTGRQWADLVPVRRSHWSLSYTEDKSGAYLSYTPGERAEVLSAQAVRARLGDDGFPLELVPPVETLQKLLTDCYTRGTVLVDHALVEGRDGTFVVHYNPDASKAYLDLFKPLGRGAPLVLKDLGLALRDAKLKGFSFDSMKGTLQEFLSGPELERKDLLLASGTPPSRAQNLEVRYLVPFISDKKLETIKGAFKQDPTLLNTVPERIVLAPDDVQKAALVRAGQEFAVFEAPADEKASEGVDVHGKPIPILSGNEPEIELLANVRKNGNKLEATIDGLLEWAELDGVTMLRVRSHTEAAAVVSRSPDNLEAFLTLVQGSGTGQKLERSLVDEALAEAQVSYGIDEAKIAEALKTIAAGGKVDTWTVARGIPAGNDLERRLQLVGQARVDAEGKKHIAVHAGETVAHYWVPQEDQIDGMDVLGNQIPSPDMEIHHLAVSEHFVVAAGEAGFQTITANASGEVLFDGEGLTLLTQVAVAGVGSHWGNVKFLGEVVVTGAVESGGYIVAGNLKVRGRVGAALLSSDHNIQITDGVHGDGKAVLRAKKHISLGFVEKSLVMAVGDVHVGKSALACTFRVNGKVFQKAAGGGLTGGFAKVRLGLDVMNLGSPSGVATVVSFGQDYLVEDQIQAEVKETDKLRDAIVQIDLVMRKLVSPQNRERLNAARQKKVLMMKLLDKRNLKLIYLRDKFDLHVPSEIVVRETLFPGVSIESHGRVYEPKGRRSAVRIRFNETTGHIEELPL